MGKFVGQKVMVETDRSPNGIGEIIDLDAKVDRTKYGILDSDNYVAAIRMLDRQVIYRGDSEFRTLDANEYGDDYGVYVVSFDNGAVKAVVIASDSVEAARVAAMKARPTDPRSATVKRLGTLTADDGADFDAVLAVQR